jgi:hypothetical protein
MLNAFPGNFQLEGKNWGGRGRDGSSPFLLGRPEHDNILTHEELIIFKKKNSGSGLEPSFLAVIFTMLSAAKFNKCNTVSCLRFVMVRLKIGITGELL